MKKNVVIAGMCLLMLGMISQAAIVLNPDADTTLSNDTDRGPTVNHGSSSALQVRWHSAPRVRISYVRYDISGISSSVYDTATLHGTCTASKYNGPVTMAVWGLNDDAAGNDWNESSINYATAAGVDNDAAVGTFAFENATYLGTLYIDGVDVQPLGFASNTTDLSLGSFLGTDTDGLVTLMFIDAEQTGAEIRIDSLEGSTSNGHGPMTMNFVPEPCTMVLLGVGGLIAIRRKRG